MEQDGVLSGQGALSGIPQRVGGRQVSFLTLGHREEHWLEEISENVAPVIPPVLEEEGMSNCRELEENCRASWTL